MIKKIFFSLLKSFTIVIIISLIGYNLYSPLKKDSIYQLEMNIEPNPMVIKFGTDTDTFSKLIFVEDPTNTYEILKFFENYVNSLHKFETIGQCSVKKIDGRIPYTLIQEEQYYKIINFKLLGDEESLKKCDEDIRNRINNLFEEKKNTIMNDYNEIQLYNSRYETKRKSMDMIISMGLFRENKLSDTQTKILQDIYENLNTTYRDYYTVLNDYSKKILKNYTNINNLNSEIKIHEKEQFILNYFYTPSIIILNLFLIILISAIELIYFKKVNLKKIYNFLFK